MLGSTFSKTAAFIAIKLYGLSRDPKFKLLDDAIITYYERLMAALPQPLRFYRSALQRRPVRSFFIFWEELLLPGDLMHVLLRKYYLHHWVQQLRGDGYEQMLVLGAGFDHLGAIHASPLLPVIEIDITAMMDFKKRFHHSANYENENLQLIGADLTHQPLAQLLENQPLLKPHKKTIVVAEGFFDYFSRPQNEHFLRTLGAYFNDQQVLLNTLFARHELSVVRSFIYRNSIRLAGEQLKLEMPLPEFTNFIESHGYELEQRVSPDQMRGELLEPAHIALPVLGGFYMMRFRR